MEGPCWPRKGIIGLGYLNRKEPWAQGPWALSIEVFRPYYSLKARDFQRCFTFWAAPWRPGQAAKGPTGQDWPGPQYVQSQKENQAQKARPSSAHKGIIGPHKGIIGPEYPKGIIGLTRK